MFCSIAAEMLLSGRKIELQIHSLWKPLIYVEAISERNSGVINPYFLHHRLKIFT